MQVIIAGCGKVGSNLARQLLALGHDIVVIEENPLLLQAIEDLDCITIIGNPIDIDVQKRAGAEVADAMVCVTYDENINVMAAEVARAIYKLPKVIVRTVNAENDESFREMGLETLCATKVIAQGIMKCLDISHNEQLIDVFGFSVLMKQQPLPARFERVRLSRVEEHLSITVAAVLREERLLPAKSDMRLLPGDRLIVAETEEGL